MQCLVAQRIGDKIMINVSPATRISFGLVMFTLSVLLMADLFGFIPKKETIMLDARKKVSEVLAVQLSIAATRSDLKTIKTSLDVFVSRNDDVVAASMSLVNGSVVAEYGKVNSLNFEAIRQETKSNDNLVVVPVFAGDTQWGTVNIEYKSLYTSNWYSIFTESIVGLLLMVALSCFAGYLFILRKSLTVLNPKEVIPDRVREAFNTLSEGVMILDKKEQIVMANDAFAEKVNKSSDELLGMKASSFKWKYSNREKRESKQKYPWVNAIQEGEHEIGVGLSLSTGGANVLSLSANCAPIQDDKGNTKGALVTFDDVTDVEETNTLLENAVTVLRKNEVEINRKNDELEVLATRDPLTGCYNRRALFDLFEQAFEYAEQTKTPVSSIMIDIDHFKLVNDRFGHSVGDEAIRMVADILNNHDSTDNAVVGRYGGEEFCVVLPGLDVTEATKIAEELRLDIEKTSKGFCEKDVSITASLGVSTINELTNSCSQLLDNADKALYVAKESGRNKVISWKQKDVVASLNDTVVIDLKDHLPAQQEAGQIEGQAEEQTEEQTEDDISKSIRLQKRIDDLENKLSSVDGGANGKQDEVNFLDAITKLPSKVILEDRITQAMAYSQRNETVMAVAILNVDLFSRINDSMGKVAGDEFLKAIGHRLKTIIRRSDTVAAMMASGQASPIFSRLRDDEFALLLTGLDDVETLTHIIKRIQDKFSGKMEVVDNEIYVTTSIGLAVYPQDGDKPNSLIEHARLAQKQAKNMMGRNNYQFYSMEDNRKIIDQMQLEIDLHNAIEGRQLFLHYQPKLNVQDNSVTSLEALVRWQHPINGVVYPDVFIPTAEKTGMILAMGQWCLREACLQTKKWVDAGAYNLRTAVNVSAMEFVDEGFKSGLVKILKETKLEARHLEIELTESIIIDEPETAHRIIEELRYIGVTVSLDDFGTGYSSLSYFGTLDIDWLKLDRSFLLEAMANSRASTMYESIVRMAHDTGVKVVAEGIETQEQFEFATSSKIDVIQGYILSKPIPVTEITNLLFTEYYENTDTKAITSDAVATAK